jgi:hypothetical protein
MRWWRRRRPPVTNQAAGVLRDPCIHLAPIEVKHELRHVYEPRPRPDSVRLIFERDGQIFQAIWPNVGYEHDLEVPDFMTGRGAPPVRLRLIPEYWRGH